MKKTLSDFVKQYKGRLVPFKKLSLPYRLSIAWYMAVDGEAWELPFELVGYMSEIKMKKLIRRNIKKFNKQYGNVKFGVIKVPIEVCKERIMQTLYVMDDNFKSFKEYHKWYLDNCGREKHTKRNLHPCILSDDFKGEFLQDGWHRFHRYVQLKIKNIPCVYYV